LCTTVIPVLRRLKQDVCKLQAHLGYMAKNKNKKKVIAEVTIKVHCMRVWEHHEETLAYNSICAYKN
jgi:hypothetical protein